MNSTKCKRAQKVTFIGTVGILTGDPLRLIFRYRNGYNNSKFSFNRRIGMPTCKTVTTKSSRRDCRRDAVSTQCPTINVDGLRPPRVHSLSETKRLTPSELSGHLNPFKWSIEDSQWRVVRNKKGFPTKVRDDFRREPDIQTQM